MLAREALLLGGRDDATVLDEGGRAVVVERGEAENAFRDDLAQKIV